MLLPKISTMQIAGKELQVLQNHRSTVLEMCSTRLTATSIEHISMEGSDILSIQIYLLSDIDLLKQISYLQE